MAPTDLLTGLPGEELIRQGLLDFTEDRQTIPACLVSIAQPRLRRAGLLPPTSDLRPPSSDPSAPTPDSELRLYRMLRQTDSDAYSRYNGLLRELVSFEQALDHRRSRQRSEAGSRKSEV